MIKSGIVRNTGMSIAVLACLAVMAEAALAQTPIPLPQPGDPAPVRLRGLIAQYYNDTVGLGAASPAPPGSVLTPTSATATFIAERLEGPINSAVTNRPPGVNDDNLYGRWSGFITTTVAGDYVIAIRIDDGGRLWFNQNPLTTTPDTASWQGQGPTTYPKTFTNLAANTRYPVTFEWFEGGVTQFAGLLWTIPGGAETAIPAANLSPPDGPAVPTLTVSSPTGPAPAKVTLNWNNPGGATGYIVSRSTTSAATGFTVLAVVNTLTYDDLAVNFDVPYWYMVQATNRNGLQCGNESNVVTATPTLAALTVNATTINVVEGGAPVVFNISLTKPLGAGQTIDFQVTTNVPTEGQVASSGQPLAPAISAQTVNFQIMGPQAVGLAIPVRVYGVDDPFVDGDKPFTVTVTFTSSQPNPFGGFTIPVINCINVDNDTPGVVVSRTSGLVTSEGGGFDTFNVRLTTSPSAPLTLNIASSNLAEGTVSAGTFVFSGANYATGANITVTGVDDALLDFAIGYTILLGFQGGGAAEYASIVPPNVSVVNLDNEVPPALPAVWGSAGCGLLGLDALLAAAGLMLLRRRRNS